MDRARRPNTDGAPHQSDRRHHDRYWRRHEGRRQPWPVVKALIAWRILVHEKGRSGLAIGGILLAILLIFLQLGFYMSVPQGGLLFYNAMRFDLMLTSSAYVFQAQSSNFPRRRLFQALA